MTLPNTAEARPQQSPPLSMREHPAGTLTGQPVLGRTSPVKKTEQFRRMLASDSLEPIMEAHNGLSAKIVEEEGFSGIWGSGLSISASLGVRDNNEASWTQVLEVVEFMLDATTIPILLDGDTGYGNFNNMRRLVRKLEQRGVAAVCIEDKLFPKTNSFVGENQPLADIDEFCGKIKAGKDTQLDDQFSIVARVEAFIAGWGLSEALKRAEAYHQAGADAILMHSKKSHPNEVLSFLKEWGGRCPVVIVPTTYYATPTKTFEEAGASVVVWANHNLRASMAAMRNLSRRLFEANNLLEVEDSLPTVRDIFKLQGNQELADAEKRYLPARGTRHKAIVLAAGQSNGFGALTKDKPKVMLELHGKPILSRIVDTLETGAISDVTVVRGYKKDAVDPALLTGTSVRTVDNDHYEQSSEVYSLACALEALRGEVVVSYGDVLFHRVILQQLLEADGDIVLAVDPKFRERRGEKPNRPVDMVRCTRAFDPAAWLEGGTCPVEQLTEVGEDDAHGEWIGLLKLSNRASEYLRSTLADTPNDNTDRLPTLIEAAKHAGLVVNTVYVAGNWLDVDDVFDLAEARDLPVSFES